jgi:predicted nucleic acid-binding Zn ribbon protein
MRPLTQALPGALAELLRDVPLSAGKVTFAWRAAVGPSVDRETFVRLENRVLLVDAANQHWAREVTRSSPLILARMQTLLGKDTVARLDIRPPRS